MNIDVIVVGGGPSGIAAATTIKRAGNNVVVIERGKNYGTKNMFGGAVYLESIKALFPESYMSAPYERYNDVHKWALLDKESSTEVGYISQNKQNSATVFRQKFDTWLHDEAKKEGVYFANSTCVREIIKKDGKVSGIKTDNEEYFAPLVIIAEGVNGKLARSLNFQKELTPKDVILGVKEVLKLPRNVIEDRFNIEHGSDSGSILEFFGGIDEDIMMLSYIYTFKEAISIGYGVLLQDLIDKKIKPYELLDKIKEHRAIKNYIKDSEIIEYSAHLIPEFGYNKMPKLYDDGVIMAGDVCGFINSIHFEGTNLAIYSGIMAGETANVAIQKQDFSSKTLKLYKEKLDKSFVMKDLKSYRNVIDVAIKRKKSIFGFYPQILSEFFEHFVCAKPVPKKAGYRKFLFDFFFKRKITELFKDCYELLKTFIEVIK